MRHVDDPGSPLGRVPLMNLVTIGVPVMVMALGILTAPGAVTVEPAAAGQGTEAEALGLSIAITTDGYQLRSSRAESLPIDSIPCVGACVDQGYDRAGLTEALGLIKERWPEEAVAVVIPDRGVSYAVLVSTIEAAREDATGRDLFPSVIIAGGLAGP